MSEDQIKKMNGFAFYNLKIEGPDGQSTSDFKVCTGAPDSYVRKCDLEKIGRYMDDTIKVEDKMYRPLKTYPGKNWLFEYSENDRYSVLGMDLLSMLNIIRLF